MTLSLPLSHCQRLAELLPGERCEAFLLGAFLYPLTSSWLITNDRTVCFKQIVCSILPETVLTNLVLVGFVLLDLWFSV